MTAWLILRRQHERRLCGATEPPSDQGYWLAVWAFFLVGMAVASFFLIPAKLENNRLAKACAAMSGQWVHIDHPFSGWRCIHP